MGNQTGLTAGGWLTSWRAARLTDWLTGELSPGPNLSGIEVKSYLSVCSAPPPAHRSPEWLNSFGSQMQIITTYFSFLCFSGEDWLWKLFTRMENGGGNSGSQAEAEVPPPAEGLLPTFGSKFRRVRWLGEGKGKGWTTSTSVCSRLWFAFSSPRDRDIGRLAASCAPSRPAL